MKHVVIVGGGVIGLSAASECARRGHRVTVVEKSRKQRGASLGNAGMIVPSHFIPLAAPARRGGVSQYSIPTLGRILAPAVSTSTDAASIHRLHPTDCVRLGARLKQV
ncbi:MAG: FAD-dependent oxidoreductase [Chthoniobacteraceae bacterium]